MWGNFVETGRKGFACGSRMSGRMFVGCRQRPILQTQVSVGVVRYGPNRSTDSVMMAAVCGGLKVVVDMLKVIRLGAWFRDR